MYPLTRLATSDFQPNLSRESNSGNYGKLADIVSHAGGGITGKNDFVE